MTSLDGHQGDLKGTRRKSVMDKIVEAFGTGLGSSIGWLAEHGVLFGIFALVWIAFGAGLILSQGSLDQAWQSIRDLPLLVQIVVWILFLPVVAGLWVWETTWPLIVRLVLVVGIGGWNLLMFLPKALQAKP